MKDMNSRFGNWFGDDRGDHGRWFGGDGPGRGRHGRRGGPMGGRRGGPGGPRGPFGPGGPFGGRGEWQELFGERPPRAERGGVRYLVLDAVNEQPRRGYEIMAAIAERANGRYKPSPGVVYPTLQLLEELGHVKVAERDEKKVYAITAAGKADLAEHAEAIVVVGATASRRGGARTAAFAQAKAAQRSLAESLARHLWPKGVHVALIVIAGVVDLPRTRAAMKDKPASYFVAPDDVAATAAFLAAQPRSAWTFELEARPFGENW